MLMTSGLEPAILGMVDGRANHLAIKTCMLPNFGTCIFLTISYTR